MRPKLAAKARRDITVGASTCQAREIEIVDGPIRIVDPFEIIIGNSADSEGEAL
jgi:hypothetical protein